MDNPAEPARPPWTTPPSRRLRRGQPHRVGASAANAAWVVTITLLSAAVTMPVSGRLADVLGKQRVLVASSVILPVGSVGCPLSDSLVPLVPHVHDTQPARVDLPGVVGLSAGPVLFLVGISKASTWGWGSGRTMGRGRHRDGHDGAGDRDAPQLQLPGQLGYELGQTLLQAGLWMAPGGPVMTVFALVASRLINGVGAKVTLMLGAAILGAGYLVALALMGAAWQIMVTTLVISTGVGYAAMPTLVLDGSPRREAGSAVGINTLKRSLATTVAAALLGTLLTSSIRTLGRCRCPRRMPSGPASSPVRSPRSSGWPSRHSSPGRAAPDTVGAGASGCLSRPGVGGLRTRWPGYDPVRS